MPLIEMLKDATGCADGINESFFQKGGVYEVSDTLCKNFIDDKLAKPAGEVQEAEPESEDQPAEILKHPHEMKVDELKAFLTKNGVDFDATFKKNKLTELAVGVFETINQNQAASDSGSPE